MSYLLNSTICHKVIAGCKVNLNLAITKALLNGYHELDSIFIPLPEPHDELFITIKNNQRGIQICCDTTGIDPTNNTLTKTYHLFVKETGFSLALLIHLKKGIPHGAGLGGGSSDAAALLTWLQSQSPSPLSRKNLFNLAMTIGADVPFFLENVPCRATGIGEQLQKISLQQLTIKGNTLVLVCPNIYISTAWAYKAWDTHYQKQQLLTMDRDILTKKNSWDRSSPSILSDNFCMKNDFEPIVFTTYPYLKKLKEQIFQFGARAAVLSGSGASICGLFTEQKAALRMVEYFQRKHIIVFSHQLL